jgi:hypothetical protein
VKLNLKTKEVLGERYFQEDKAGKQKLEYQERQGKDCQLIQQPGKNKAVQNKNHCK